MKCHCCGSFYKKVKSNPDFFKCSNCGHGHRPYTGDIVKFHTDLYRTKKKHQRCANEFDKEGNPTNFFFKAREAMNEKRIKLIKKYLPKEQTCLDIGAGGGNFAIAVSPFVKTVHCQELHPKLTKAIKSKGFKTFYGDFFNLDIKYTYDIVTAWHVLEHVENLKSFISKCSKLSNNLIVIEVPCDRKLTKDFDGHLHHFSKSSLETLMKSQGLNILEIKDGIQMPSILIICQK